MKADSGTRRVRRGWVYAVTPAVAAVLAVVAVVAVVVHNTRHDNTPTNSALFHAGVTSPVKRPTTKVTKTTTTPAPPPPPATPVDNPALATAAVNAVDGSGISGVSYGVAILDRNSGAVTLGQLGSKPFYSASVVKLFVVTYLLHQREAGAISLDAGMMNNITRALELSDDDAMNAFWNDFGGSALVTQASALFGLQDTAPPAVVGQWGQTTISARDVLKVYNYVFAGLAPADSALVLGDLGQAANTAADGFNQAFGLLQPPRPQSVKAKQGWMQIPGDSLTLNTTGVLGARNQYVVAILTRQPISLSYDTGSGYVTHASQLVEQALAPGLA